MVLLDLYYIENWSPVSDLQIMLRTVPKVIVGEGAF
jgi:lipopolysaccharide/colanic/teichoic acid biosynthesis glycosyltransferase